VGFGLTYDIVLTARGFHPLKVSASEHRAVANGREERRIEKRVRGGRRKTKRRSMTQQNPPHVGGVITSEGWSKRPKMSFKNQISYRAAGSAGVSLIGVGNWVRLGVSFVCTVCSASGPVVSVVGDDRSGDPLHERCDESDVYKGKVAQVGMVPDLVGRLNTLADRKSTIY
jgi:hypothetical protein